MLGSQLPGFPGCALHARPSRAVAFGNPSGLKHWLKALRWLSRPPYALSSSFPYTGLPLGIVALVGFLQVRSPF